MDILAYNDSLDMTCIFSVATESWGDAESKARQRLGVGSKKEVVGSGIPSFPTEIVLHLAS